MSNSLFDTQVLPLFEETREAWLERARATARELASGGRSITIDDVREKCPPPEGVDPRVMGAVFRPIKDWEVVGYERSSRASCHNRPVARHRLKG